MGKSEASGTEPKTKDLGSRQEKNRGGTKDKVGEGAGTAEEGVEPSGACKKETELLTNLIQTPEKGIALHGLPAFVFALHALFMMFSSCAQLPTEPTHP
jgi:hypothetical protein